MNSHPSATNQFETKAAADLTVSVMIPAHNSSQTIEACLKALRLSEVPDCEIIVVDDASADDTAQKAAQWADCVVARTHQGGRSEARNDGFDSTRGDLIINIDSDVMVYPDTIAKIVSYFENHAGVDAVTGRLSREHLNNDFFSLYKNDYMNYIFSRLPQRVDFLYGSVCAVRRKAWMKYNTEFDRAVDTELGQNLVRHGRVIHFVPELQVIHMKRYNFLSLIRNDFLVPNNWARIFVRYQGWRQIFRRGKGFAHSPPEQLLSLMFAASLLFGMGQGLMTHAPVMFLVLSGSVWLLLNLRFFIFLTRERGLVFGSKAVVFTLLDHWVMTLGIVCGLITALRRQLFREDTS